MVTVHAQLAENLSVKFSSIDKHLHKSPAEHTEIICASRGSSQKKLG